MSYLRFDEVVVEERDGEEGRATEGAVERDGDETDGEDGRESAGALGDDERNVGCEGAEWNVGDDDEGRNAGEDGEGLDGRNAGVEADGCDGEGCERNDGCEGAAAPMVGAERKLGGAAAEDGPEKE